MDKIYRSFRSAPRAPSTSRAPPAPGPSLRSLAVREKAIGLPRSTREGNQFSSRSTREAISPAPHPPRAAPPLPHSTREATSSAPRPRTLRWPTSGRYTAQTIHANVRRGELLTTTGLSGNYYIFDPLTHILYDPIIDPRLSCLYSPGSTF